jgi:hypothetical protein
MVSRASKPSQAYDEMQGLPLNLNGQCVPCNL